MEDKSKGSLEKIILAGIGAMALSAERSKEMLDELIKKGELTVEQGKVINEELKHTIKTKASEASKSAQQVVASKIIQNLDKLSADARKQILSKLQELESSEDGKNDTSER